MSAPGLIDVEPTTERSAIFVDRGKPLCFEGTNNYYLTFKGKEMVDDVLVQAKVMNLKVIRFWAFVDRGSLDGSVPSANGEDSKDGVYFQYWDTARQAPAFNEGENGLGRLDYVLHKARALDLKLILVLTNNWRDFGGMDQYLVWYGLKQHHLFYTDPRIRVAYKDWVAHLIGRTNSIDGTRYREDPAIFAWELANEPRAKSYKDFDADGWGSNTITTWAAEMASFIKSLDPNHMVSVGDEGFFKSGREDSTYKAMDGVAHEDLIAIDAVDFATFHMYPDHWGTNARKWGTWWVEDHIDAARKVGKPTVLEEYGVIVQREDKETLVGEVERRLTAYRNWNELMLKKGGNGSMVWMLAGYDPRFGRYPDYDGFTVYREEETGKLIERYAELMKREAKACTAAEPVVVPPSPYVTVQRLGSVRPQAYLPGVLPPHG
jgi:mannan endo-1,4-beta-mannosidase